MIPGRIQWVKGGGTASAAAEAVAAAWIQSPARELPCAKGAAIKKPVNDKLHCQTPEGLVDLEPPTPAVPSSEAGLPDKGCQSRFQPRVSSPFPKQGPLASAPAQAYYPGGPQENSVCVAENPTRRASCWPANGTGSSAADPRQGDKGLPREGDQVDRTPQASNVKDSTTADAGDNSGSGGGARGSAPSTGQRSTAETPSLSRSRGKLKPNECSTARTGSSLAALQVRDLALSPQWLGFDPWPGNVHMLWAWPEKKNRKKTNHPHTPDPGAVLPEHMTG